MKKISLVSLALLLFVTACAPTQEVAEVADPEPVQEKAVMEEKADLDAGEAEEPAVEEEIEVSEVSFSMDVWPIIEQNALNAHGGKGGIFLESYDDIVKQVVPGDPENSMLYKVLTGNGAPQMPPGNPLSEDLIQTIYDWIEQGAKDN